jgi:hypothetical protein
MHARAIAPYVRAGTLAVAHLDLARIDLDAWLAIFQRDAKLSLTAEPEFKKAAGRQIVEFAKAGVSDLYVLFDMADLLDGPFLIVPFKVGADADAIVHLLEPKGEPVHSYGFSPFANRAEVVEKLDKAVFSGSKATLMRLRASQPEARPEVTMAFASVPNTVAQVLLLPTADSRRVLEELMPRLPKDLGGDPVTVATHGATWAAFGLQAPPQARFQCVIQSRDAESALALQALIAKILRIVTTGGHGPIGAYLAHNAQFAELLTPQVSGDKLTLTLTLDQENKDLVKMIGAWHQGASGSAARMRCINQMKQIVLAMHNYYDVYKTFPANANFDKNGKPLLSWRVHLLPFLDQAALYKEFHLDEPWDSEHNKRLIERMPDVYRCPAMNRSLVGKSSFLVPLGTSLMFTGGPDGVLIKDVTDGTSNTIFIVDVDDAHALTWTKPDDLKIDEANPAVGLRLHDGVFIAAFVDGAVHSLKANLDKKNLWALFTRNGGEVVSFPY